jgi:hypothetical protein
MALKELEDRLPPMSPPDEPEPLLLDLKQANVSRNIAA